MKPFSSLKPWSLRLFSSLTAAGLLGFFLAVVTAQHGCASSCGNYCPATLVYIGSGDDAQLSVAFDVNGPACPPASSVQCLGDQSSTTCTYATVTAVKPGRCDVLVQFNPYSDGRPSEIVELEFGQPYAAPGTCCPGYPVIGPSVYIIPDHPSQGGIYSPADGGVKDYDAIFVIRDGGADAKDAGASDAGADSLSADAK
jgi:hypothetical protein